MKDQDYYFDILYLNLEKIKTTIQISSISTRLQIKIAFHISSISTWPKTTTAIQISSIPTCQKFELLFKHPMFLPSLRPRLLLNYPLFRIGKNQECYADILYFYPAYDQDYNSNIACFYLTKIGTAI